MSRMITLTLLLLGTPVLMIGQQSVPVAELVQQFKTSRVFWQQFEVAEKLAKSHDRAVLEQLETYLKDEDRHVRGNAAFVFAALGDESRKRPRKPWPHYRHYLEQPGFRSPLGSC